MYKENLSNNQKDLDFSIISFILMTWMFDSGQRLLVETGFLSLSFLLMKHNSFLTIKSIFHIQFCFVYLDFLPCTPKLETVSCESVSLHGHSGPVYATQFSPDSSVLLSASEDTTGEFKTNITDFYFWVIMLRWNYQITRPTYLTKSAKRHLLWNEHANTVIIWWQYQETKVSIKRLN